MADAGNTGRPNQKRRARKALLQAASRLMGEGRKPGLEEVAAEALLLEVPLDVAIPAAAEVFRGGPPEDPVARLERVDAALHDMIRAKEAPLRIMLARSLESSPATAKCPRARTGGRR